MRTRFALALATLLVGCNGGLLVCSTRPDLAQRSPLSADAGPCRLESAAEACTRLGLECGATVTADGCGGNATVTCGACPSPNTCLAGRCGCWQPDDVCAIPFARCGHVEAKDSCGNEHRAWCGLCSEGKTCIETRCSVCESDLAFCARHAAACGWSGGLDDCGRYRAVDCGACAEGECCTDNRCEPRSDRAVCAAAGAGCGVLHASRCPGSPEVDCGSCASGATCSTDLPNTCVTPELCAAQQVECGLVIDWTTGRSAHCGTCAPGQVCWGGGPGRCGPADCEADWCWQSWSGPPGTDAFFARAPWGVWTARNEEVLRYPGHEATVARWDGRVVSTLPPVEAVAIEGLWAANPSAVFGFASSLSSNDGLLLRWDGSRWWQDAFPYGFNALWGSSADDVWAVGGSQYGGQVVRWDGQRWSAVDVPAESALSAVHGSGPDDVWAVGARAWHWDGRRWSSIGPMHYLPFSSVFVRGPSDVWLGATRELWNWDGSALNWVPAPNNGRIDAIAGSPAGDVWVAESDAVYRRIGNGWQVVARRSLPEGLDRGWMLSCSAPGELWILALSSGDIGVITGGVELRP